MTDTGAEVHRGDLDDLDGLQTAAAAADGVIHLAFKHESMRSGDFVGAVDADLRAIEAIGAGLEGSDKPLVTSLRLDWQPTHTGLIEDLGDGHYFDG